jgi:hypothetical protein
MGDTFTGTIELGIDDVDKEGECLLFRPNVGETVGALLFIPGNFVTEDNSAVGVGAVPAVVVIDVTDGDAA